MKKQILTAFAALGMISMLCGFDSAETADSVLQKMAEAEAAQTGMSATIDMNVDAQLNLSDGTTTSSLGLAASAALNVTSNSLQPAAMVEGSAEYSLPMLGGETVIVKSYVVPSEDGTLKTYAYSENSTSGESGWVVEPLSGLTADDLVSANSSLDVSDLAEYGITFELAPEAVDINGTECYMLTSVIDVTTLETIMEKAADQLGEDISDISSVLYFLNGLKVNFVSYVDTATYLPVQNVIDMNDSDLSMINSLLGSYLGSLESGEAPATTYEVVLNDVSMTITPAFADVAEITVPDEALQAEASGEAYSLTDAASTVIE